MLALQSDCLAFIIFENLERGKGLIADAISQKLRGKEELLIIVNTEIPDAMKEYFDMVGSVYTLVRNDGKDYDECIGFCKKHFAKNGHDRFHVLSVYRHYTINEVLVNDAKGSGWNSDIC